MFSAVIFDLDGTLTMTPNPWRHIHERLGVWEHGACTHLDQWLTGQITYDEFCVRDTRLWSGRLLPELEGYLDEIEMNLHVPGIVDTLVREGIPSVIISSGFQYVARRIQTDCNWGPLQIYANELIEGPGVRIHVSPDSSSPISKKALADIALRNLGVPASETLVVSDAQRDLDLLAHCGYHLHVREEDDLLHIPKYWIKD